MTKSHAFNRFRQQLRGFLKLSIIQKCGGRYVEAWMMLVVVYFGRTLRFGFIENCGGCDSAEICRLRIILQVRAEVPGRYGIVKMTL